jgi:hypothetical protein
MPNMDNSLYGRFDYHVERAAFSAFRLFGLIAVLYAFVKLLF